MICCLLKVVLVGKRMDALWSYFSSHADHSLGWIPRSQIRCARHLAKWAADSCRFDFLAVSSVLASVVNFDSFGV